MKKNDTDYGYYSKLLNKPFDTIEELKAAEEEVRIAEKEKEEKAKAKKAEASKDEEAFKELNEAKKLYNSEITAAKKAYAKIVADAKDALNKSILEAEKNLECAQTKYSDALKEFTDKHPEGYHVTLKDGDNITTISRTNTCDSFMSFNKLFDSFFDNWF